MIREERGMMLNIIGRTKTLDIIWDYTKTTTMTMTIRRLRLWRRWRRRVVELRKLIHTSPCMYVIVSYYKSNIDQLYIFSISQVSIYELWSFKSNGLLSHIIHAILSSIRSNISFFALLFFFFLMLIVHTLSPGTSQSQFKHNNNKKSISRTTSSKNETKMMTRTMVMVNGEWRRRLRRLRWFVDENDEKRRRNL